jgi:hypothetical protein
MQLYFGGVPGQVITQSYFGHQSQVRAQQWAVDEGVNWAALKYNPIAFQYHERKRPCGGKGWELSSAARGTEVSTIWALP